jgi:hypothetical protein
MSKSERFSQRNNEWSNWHFAIATGGVIALSIAHHWLSVIYFRYARETSSIFGKRSVRNLKYARHGLNRYIAGAHRLQVSAMLSFAQGLWVSIQQTTFIRSLLGH